MLTRVCSKSQFVFVFPITNAKQVVLGVSCLIVEVFEFHSKPALFFCQAVNVIKSKPIFTSQISKASFVVVPAAVEINRAVQSLLEHCPPPSGCCLVTIHIKDTAIVRIDRVNTTDSMASFVEFSTVLVNWKRTERLNYFNSWIYDA